MTDRPRRSWPAVVCAVMLASSAMAAGCRSDDVPWPDVFEDFDGRARLPDTPLAPPDRIAPDGGDASDTSANDVAADQSASDGPVDASMTDESAIVGDVPDEFTDSRASRDGDGD